MRRTRNARRTSPASVIASTRTTRAAIPSSPQPSEQLPTASSSGDYLEIALALESVLRRLQTVPMNVDGATATIYAELGLPAELARGLFILSRSVGLLAHAREQQQDPTRIKGPLPKSIIPTYTGHPPRSL